MAATAEAGTIPIYNIMKKTSQWLVPTLKYEIPMAWRNWDVIFTPMEYKHYAIEITPMKMQKRWKCLWPLPFQHFLLSKSQWLGVFGCVFPLYIEKTSS